jgi:hypothetical protein
VDQRPGLPEIEEDLDKSELIGKKVVRVRGSVSNVPRLYPYNKKDFATGHIYSFQMKGTQGATIIVEAYDDLALKMHKDPRIMVGIYLEVVGPLMSDRGSGVLQVYAVRCTSYTVLPRVITGTPRK